MVATKLETLLCLTALAALLNLSNGLLNGNAAETSKQWKLISYNFPANAQINDRKFYNPENVLITGLAVGLDRIFIATPQLLSGVPSALNAISKSGLGDSPVLEAFPDWTFATGGRNDFNCSEMKVVSVYRLKIDSCNRLWVLDAGVSRSLEDYEITCPPKILVIDLNTNLVVRRIDFPPEVLRGESLLTNLVIDETTSKLGTCDDVFVYMSDTVEPALIVYDSQQDVTWRLSHPAMYPDPDFAQSEILGDRFVLMDGVVGLAFDDKSGILYFQPLATDRVFSVTREVLRGGPLATNQLLPVKLVGRKSSQGISLGVSPIDSSLLFSPLTETAIASWNPQTGQQSILASDTQRLQFVADIGTSFFEPGVIYLISSKFQRFFLKNLNTNEYNNRILRIDLNAIAGQSLPALAAPPSRTHSYSYYHSNSLEKRPTFGLPIDDNFFSSASAGLTTRQPFRFEPVGVVQQSFRNPFTALNQGEALPTRLTRVPPVRSFLDNLPPSGYNYRRLNRSAAGGGAKSR